MNCPDCNNLLELKVLLGPMGYFLGFGCECGFWKDESSHIGTLKEANRYLAIAKGEQHESRTRNGLEPPSLCKP